MKNCIAVVLLVLLVTGCTDETAPTAVVDHASAESATLATGTEAKAGQAAWVVRIDDNICSVLPGIGPGGEVLVLFDVPCKLKFIDTQNGNGNAHATFKASFRNDFGKAVQVTFGQPLPIPCTFVTASGVVETTKYQFSIAKNGNLMGVCHLPDG